jgi:hypothetical protein
MMRSKNKLISIFVVVAAFTWWTILGLSFVRSVDLLSSVASRAILGFCRHKLG